MSTPARFLTDWRGPGRWTPEDRARPADILSCWQTWTQPPIPGVPTLPVFSLTLYQGPAEMRAEAALEPWGRPAILKGYVLLDSAGRPREVWRRDDGTARTIALDPTKRGFVVWMAEQVVQRFAWAQGIHWDYFTDFEWLFADVDPLFWPKYRAGMDAVCGEIRRRRPDWLIIGQNYHFPEGTGGYLDGLYLEQTPTMFGMTLADHSRDLEMHRTLLALSGRKAPLWVCEVREPARIAALNGGPAYLSSVAAWCTNEQVALSWGRDATAGVGFPTG